MSTQSWVESPPRVIYPDSDGEPMAENTLQFQWIVTIKENLERIFRDNEDVFVAGDLLWYPVEGNNKIRMAPDAMVVFGRPKGHRGSYQQWEEEGISPQVVFEVLSPGNRFGKMLAKLRFYEQHGVQEYYIYDPDHEVLDVLLRQNDRLVEMDETDRWVSPKLGIRFQFENGGLVIYRPDGQRFLTFAEVLEQSERNQRAAQDERERAERERLRVQQLEARLRSLGVDPSELDTP